MAILQKVHHRWPPRPRVGSINKRDVEWCLVHLCSKAPEEKLFSISLLASSCHIQSHRTQKTKIRAWAHKAEPRTGMVARLKPRIWKA